MLTKIYGAPAPGKHRVLAGIDCSSQKQARLLQEILENELRERAGKPEESLLAAWHRHVSRFRERAKREAWAGWEGV